MSSINIFEGMCANITGCCTQGPDQSEMPLFERLPQRKGVKRGFASSLKSASERAAKAGDADASVASQQSTAQGQIDDMDPHREQTVYAMFPFVGQDPQPFPPDPYPDLSIEPGDKLRVFPSMNQHGWCFVVDARKNARRGWVPGNYVTANGLDPYFSAGGALEQQLWSKIRTSRTDSDSLKAKRGDDTSTCTGS